MVVVHDTQEEARERGVVFCDRLVERFWHRCEFDVCWWSFQLLKDSASAELARQRATRADMVVFATDGELPFEVKAWSESVLRSRGEREGALVCLSPPEKGGALSHLRCLAHRAGMDFLTDIPGTLMQPMPQSLDGYSERAEAVTSVLDDILRQKHVSSRALPGLLPR